MHDDPFAHGLVAPATVALPVLVAVLAARRAGREIVPLLAVIAPFVTWIITSIFCLIVLSMGGDFPY
ncbi:MAG: hypothetical protein H7305_10010 [Gemmatimonadaceae bacterium]|nr:hypothetical protein [Gemmatimonadaceae bacterium]